jgi:hypothetical protein
VKSKPKSSQSDRPGSGQERVGGGKPCPFEKRKSGLGYREVWKGENCKECCVRGEEDGGGLVSGNFSFLLFFSCLFLWLLGERVGEGKREWVVRRRRRMMMMWVWCGIGGREGVGGWGSRVYLWKMRI